jgi:hypothetical protein
VKNEHYKPETGMSHSIPSSHSWTSLTVYSEAKYSYSSMHYTKYVLLVPEKYTKFALSQDLELVISQVTEIISPYALHCNISYNTMILEEAGWTSLSKIINE